MIHHENKNIPEKEQEYTVSIGNLKISGPAEDIHKLALVYGLASCEYGHQITDELHGEHNDDYIVEWEDEQKELDKIYRQLIDTIRDSEYYRRSSAELSAMIDSVLEEIEHDGH